jgi:nucleoside-diphosphate-sugar epimerase
MKILVTGASGFLGLNLLKHLAQAHPAAEIVAADVGEPPAEDRARIGVAAGRIEYRPLDVTDFAACRGLMELTRATLILHAAAVTLPDESVRSKDLTYSINLEGTRNVLKAAVSAGSLERFILLSSSGVYKQSNDDAPCDEEHPLDLSMSYADAKHKAEMLMEEYERTGNFPVVAARVGPVYGEFERSRRTRPNVSMVQRLLSLLDERRIVRIAGADTHRDWTHAGDIAAGLDALLCARTLNHRIYNVSSGISVSARGILDVFIENGLKVEWATSETDADIVLNPRENRKTLVIDRLLQETGFTPRFDIRAGLSQLLAARKQSATAIDNQERCAQ